MGTSLYLRTCTKGGYSYNGFQWPLTVGATVVAPDWSAEAECGNGLHGLRWGEGDGSLLGFESDVWMVVEANDDEAVSLTNGAKYKFPRCVVRYVGTRRGAVQFILDNGGAGKMCAFSHPHVGDHGVAKAGYAGTATVGDCGVAKVGPSGLAKAGRDGEAVSGTAGFSIAGERGQATTGHRGTAHADYCGTATAGDYGIATAGTFGCATTGRYGVARVCMSGKAKAGPYGEALAGDRGTAEAGDFGTAKAGDLGIAIAGRYGVAMVGRKGQAQVGYGGRIQIEYAGSDDRTMVAIGYATGLANDIKADTLYQVIDGKLVEAQ